MAINFLKHIEAHEQKSQGFTLVEILVALVMASFIIIQMFNSFDTQNKSSVVQGNIVEIQQSLRAGLYLMTDNIQMAGYDPNDNFGTTNGISTASATTLSINIWDDTTSSIDNLTYTYDNLNRTLDQNGSAIAVNIEAIGFAYAYDADNNGRLDTSAAGNILWAIDSDNDTDLDAHLDDSDDGFITIADTPGGVALAPAYTSNINFKYIRAVKVWILAEASNDANDFTDANTYIVGSQHISNLLYDPNRRHRLLTMTIACRNMGLQ